LYEPTIFYVDNTCSGGTRIAVFVNIKGEIQTDFIYAPMTSCMQTTTNFFNLTQVRGATTADIGGGGNSINALGTTGIPPNPGQISFSTALTGTPTLSRLYNNVIDNSPLAWGGNTGVPSIQWVQWQYGSPRSVSRFYYWNTTVGADANKSPKQVRLYYSDPVLGWILVKIYTPPYPSGGVFDTGTIDETLGLFAVRWKVEVDVEASGPKWGEFQVFSGAPTIGGNVEWDFDDGSPVSTLQNPTHLYTTSGVYNVSLTLNEPGICPIPDTVPITFSDGGSSVHYRSQMDGVWTDLNVWEVSLDLATWYDCLGYDCGIDYPTSRSKTIQVNHNVNYNFTIPYGIDETTINTTGNLIIDSAITCLMVDSSASAVAEDIANKGKLTITGGFTVVGTALLKNFTLAQLPPKGSIVHYNGDQQDMWDGIYSHLWIDGTQTDAGSLKVVSGNNTVVTDTLKFINGKISLGNLNVTLLNTAKSVGQSQNTGYCIATNAGHCVWEYPSGVNVSHIFPVGGNYYSPAVIDFDNVTVQGTLPCRVTELVHPEWSASLERYWAFRDSLPGDIQFTGYYDATFTYNDADLQPGENDDGPLEMAAIAIGGAYNPSYKRGSSGNYWYYSPDSINPYSKDVTINQFTLHHKLFSEETAGSEPAPGFPVDLMLYANWRGNDGLVQWVTFYETNNDRFDLERSTDGKNYSKIISLKGKGNSNEKTTYSYLDKNLREQNDNQFYYRLKQTDYDGNHKYYYTSLRKDGNQEEGLVKVLPNPIGTGQDLLVVYYLPEDGELNFTVVDLLGRTIYEKNHKTAAGLVMINLPTTALSPAMYNLKVGTRQKKSVFKFVVISR